MLHLEIFRFSFIFLLFNSLLLLKNFKFKNIRELKTSNRKFIKILNFLYKPTKKSFF